MPIEIHHDASLFPKTWSLWGSSSGHKEAQGNEESCATCIYGKDMVETFKSKRCVGVLQANMGACVKKLLGGAFKVKRNSPDFQKIQDCKKSACQGINKREAIAAYDQLVKDIKASQEKNGADSDICESLVYISSFQARARRADFL
jgi:hypothetical protein